MKEVKFSIYEVTMLERYLQEFIKLKEKEEIKNNTKYRQKFSSIEYDKKQIKILLSRLRGNDYKEEISLDSRNYSRDMYIGEGEDE